MTHAVPVQESARVNAVDAARGLALLGIFCVNIQFFAEPFGAIMTPGGHSGPLDAAVDYFVHIFCMGKFYGLFSLLFGVGFALQRTRVLDRGVSFAGVYVRRIAFLFVMGLLHALLLWYGDILFIYSLVAVVLLICGKCKPRTMVISGIVLLLLYAMVATPFSGLQGPAEKGEQAASEAVPEKDAADTAKPDAPRDPFWSTPFGQLMDGFKHGRIQDPSSKEWQSLETRVYQEGPYSQLFLFRAFSWAMMLFWTCLMGFNLSVLAMFFFGAALANTDSFSPARAPLHRRLVLAGLAAGLPLSVFAAYAMEAHGASAMWRMAATFAGVIGSPLMSLAYLGAMTLFVHSGAGAALAGALMATGRMALTNYLTQSLVATTVFYYYGLGQFGRFSRAQELLLVLGVYAAQVLISVLWMRAFRFGPLEWLWRSFTYLQAPPMRRG